MYNRAFLRRSASAAIRNRTMRVVMMLAGLLAIPAAAQNAEDPSAEATEAARENPSDIFTPEERGQSETQDATEDDSRTVEDAPAAEGPPQGAEDRESAIEEVVPPPDDAPGIAAPGAQEDSGEPDESGDVEDPGEPGEAVNADAPTAELPDAAGSAATPADVPQSGEARVLAEGSPEAGQAKSAKCAACHGADGNSFNPEWPSLAGQHAEYIVRQLEAFQSGARQNVLMTPQAQGLSQQDMRDLAAYYAAQLPKPSTADPELARLGEEIYRGGNPERGASACIACHGPTGTGNPAAGYPLVRGQHAVYLAAALEAYARGERRSDPNQVMRNIASLLDDEEALAVATYMQGLRPNEPSGQ
ncbi:hypothetical protein BH24PSE2_BH24PSE2_05040 [soil metagenome]